MANELPAGHPAESRGDIQKAADCYEREASPELAIDFVREVRLAFRRLTKIRFCSWFATNAGQCVGFFQSGFRIASCSLWKVTS